MVKPLMALGIALGLFALSPPPAAATEVHGQTMTTNTTWNAAGNPYHVTGDIEVAAGVTLTLGPGVHVVIEPDADDTMGGNDPTKVEFVIHGNLVVAGTAAQRVTFTPAGAGVAGTTAGTWNYIGLFLGSTASIDYASIGGATIGILTFATGTATAISNTQIYDFGGTGIVVFDGSPTIDSTLISSNGATQDVGLQVLDTGAAVITNLVVANAFIGVDIDPSANTVTSITNATVYSEQTAATGILIHPAMGNPLVASIVNSAVIVPGNSSSAAATYGIALQNTPGTTVTLSHNAVVATNPYSGIAAGPASMSATTTSSSLPGFVSSTDFHLTAASSLIDAGTNAGAPTDDIENHTRPVGGATDIGAYKFGGGATVPTANAGPDQTLTAGAGGTASITLTGVGGPAGETLTYLWTEGSTTLATTASFTYAFTPGVHLLTFTVTISGGLSASDTVLIGVATAGGGGTGTAGPAGPKGDSVAIQLANPVACANGGVQLTVADANAVVVNGPFFICNGLNGSNGTNGANGATGAQGPAGSAGPAGPAGTALPGSVLFVVKGTPAPAGYRFVGSTKQVVPGAGQIDMDVYVKR